MHGATHKTPRMSEIDSQTVVILFSVTVGLFVILLATVAGIRRRLARIERLLIGSAGHPEDAGSADGQVEGSSGGAFEMFLGEDPSRRDLPKGEQFAQYRKWRQEKGLNWSNS